MDNSEPKNTNRAKNGPGIGSLLLASFNKVRLLIEQGFVCALLLVGVISVAVYGYNRLANGNSVGTIPFTVWQLCLIITTFILGLIIAVGLPILWGRVLGFKRVLGILTWEFILLAIAVVIAAFVINSKGQNNSSCFSTFGVNNSDCVLPDTTLSPTQQ